MKNLIKIYFICPTNPQPSGGVKQIYKMVDALNDNGFNAFVVHKKPGHKEMWFENNTKILHNRYIFKLIKYLDKEDTSFINKIKLQFLKSKSFAIQNEDIIVFPEIYSNINDIFPNIRKVIFNQNCYYSFNGFPLEKSIDNFPYKNPKTIGLIVVSEDSEMYLKCISKNEIYRIHLGIDSKIFHYSAEKQKKIAFMPRKLSHDITQVVQIFKIRNPESKWKFCAIDNMCENNVADILKSSTIFLSFNEKEGFGLPPVEAMACGCYVIGYRGQAGKEYFNQNFSAPVEEGNIIQFVKELEKATSDFEKFPDEIIKKGKTASEFVENNYNLKRERNDILEIWNKIIEHH